MARARFLLVLSALLVGCDDEADTTSTAATTGAMSSGSMATGTGGASTTSGSGSASTGTGVGGGVPDGLAVSFPPASSITDQPTLTIRGTASLASAVDSITVGGKQAESTDGFVHWSANVPLALGAQDVPVVVGGGGPTVTVHVDRRATLLQDPMLLVLDSANGRAFASSGIVGADNVIRAVDLTTGEATVVSSATKGSGPAFDERFYTLSWDPVGQRLLAFDNEKLWSVDVSTGDRQVVATHGSGVATWPTDENEARVDTQGNRLIATASYSSGDPLMAVDLTTYGISILSRNSNSNSGPPKGTGPDLDEVHGLALDLPNGRALVADGGASTGLVAVHLATGDRTPISSQFGPGAGPWTALPDSVARFGGRAWVSSYAILDTIAVDLATGNRSFAVDEGIGSGPQPLGFSAIDADATGLFGVDLRFDAIVRVDPDTLVRTLVGGYGIGAGHPFYVPTEFAWDPFANQFVVRDHAGVFGVDPDTGERTVLSSYVLGVGQGGFNTGFADDMEIGASAFYLADSTLILRIDRATGDRSVLSGTSSGMTIGAGPQFGIVMGLASSPDGSKLFAMQSDGTLMTVDPTTGDRAVLSSATVGAGPVIQQGRDVVFDPAGNRLFVTSDVAAVYSIDVVTGDRAEISSMTKGSGPITLGMMQLAADGLWVVWDQLWTHIDATTGDRTRVLDGGVGPGFRGKGHVIRPDGRFYASDTELGGVLAVDRVSGERVLLSR